MAAAAFEGASIGPLIELAISFDPRYVFSIDVFLHVCILLLCNFVVMNLAGQTRCPLCFLVYSLTKSTYEIKSC